MEKETILKIEEFYKEENVNANDFLSRYSGYKIDTNKQTIIIGIDSDQQCYEDWGYFIIEDDISDFINADLLGIEFVDTCLNVTELKQKEISIDDCIFVNLQTSEGTLQIVVYNEHNGYYGHDVIIKSQQLTKTIII